MGLFKRVGALRVARMVEPDKIIDALGVDPDLVLRFLGVFSRFEFALKRSEFLKGSRNAEANWDAYAKWLRGTFRSVEDTRFTEAVACLRNAPPKKQVVSGGDINWEGTSIREGECLEQYVLRLVRAVRNNLFHGGKYPSPVGPLEDVGRNQELIEMQSVFWSAARQEGVRMEREFRPRRWLKNGLN